MGLMKLGVSRPSGRRDLSSGSALIGYGVECPSSWPTSPSTGISFLHRRLDGLCDGGLVADQFGERPFIALGHVAVVMLIYKAGALGWLTRRFAAVGRI